MQGGVEEDVRAHFQCSQLWFLPTNWLLETRKRAWLRSTPQDLRTNPVLADGPEGLAARVEAIQAEAPNVFAARSAAPAAPSASSSSAGAGQVAVGSSSAGAGQVTVGSSSAGAGQAKKTSKKKAAAQRLHSATGEEPSMPKAIPDPSSSPGDDEVASALGAAPKMDVDAGGGLADAGSTDAPDTTVTGDGPAAAGTASMEDVGGGVAAAGEADAASTAESEDVKLDAPVSAPVTEAPSLVAITQYSTKGYANIGANVASAFGVKPKMPKSEEQKRARLRSAAAGSQKWAAKPKVPGPITVL